MGISPKINKHGGSNNHEVGRIPQKLINMEVLIRHVVGKFFSKRIRKTPCLLEISEYFAFLAVYFDIFAGFDAFYRKKKKFS